MNILNSNISRSSTDIHKTLSTKAAYLMQSFFLLKKIYIYFESILNKSWAKKKKKENKRDKENRFSGYAEIY